ncbi:DUF3301 domain-containing protein [Arenimonas oryziterrae]|nr:DUF3301 domain-containing protein [Arenimonas oryziterrae]
MILLMLAAPAIAYWSAGRAAAELAVHHGRRACYHAGVQWLDQSVHLVKVRLRRSESGWLGWERHFRFEYSSGGEDRRAGLVIMHGRALAGLVGPMPEEASVH